MLFVACGNSRPSSLPAREAFAFVLIYLRLALNLWYPGPSFQLRWCCGLCRRGNRNINIVSGRGGEKRGKCVQDTRKSNFTAKCLNTFDAHCSSKFIITSVVLDIRNRSLLMAWWGGESFWGDHWNFSSSLYAVFAGKNPSALQKKFFSLEIELGTYMDLYSFESSMKWPFLDIFSFRFSNNWESAGKRSGSLYLFRSL